MRDCCWLVVVEGGLLELAGVLLGLLGVVELLDAAGTVVELVGLSGSALESLEDEVSGILDVGA